MTSPGPAPVALGWVGALVVAASVAAAVLLIATWARLAAGRAGRAAQRAGPYADADTIEEPGSGPGDDALRKRLAGLAALKLPPVGSGEWAAAGAVDWPTVPEGEAHPRAPTVLAAGSLRAWLWGEQGVAGEYLLASRLVRVGRDPASDIVLDDQTVSRAHATLNYADGGWWLLPAVTGNGTWVNGHIVRPGERVPVWDNDRLRFGLHTQLRLRVPPGRPG
jgi:FHA domain